MLVAGIVFNFGLLVGFKYIEWLWPVVSWLVHDATGILVQPLANPGTLFDGDKGLQSLRLDKSGQSRLPIGVSFFTLQGSSYLVDIFRGDVAPKRSLVNFATYKSFFPQPIAGPIVR